MPAALTVFCGGGNAGVAAETVGTEVGGGAGVGTWRL
jgi:hypothetical protein